MKENLHKKKLLIIELDQFGYLTDSLKWCEHLSDSYDIQMVCYDSGREKVKIPNVKVHYVKLSHNRILHAARFFMAAIKAAFFAKGRIIVVAFPHCDIIKRVLPWKKMQLDIRTVSVSRNDKERASFDKQLHNYGQIYDFVSVISEGVKRRLNLPNATVLPLGADVISEKKKDYSKHHFLYVGTLNSRDIDKTIHGVSLFMKKYPDAQLKYDIIGEGIGCNGKLSDEYRRLVNDLDLNDTVNIHGAKPYSELKPFLENASYGVSFVPITPWYNVQPPTKTYEYTMSGLFVIGTATDCNKEIITDNNGLLINDSPEDFARALEFTLHNHQRIDEDKVRLSLADFQWGNIVNKMEVEILNKQ